MHKSHYNVIVLGSGAREDALYTSIKKSPLLGTLHRAYEGAQEPYGLNCTINNAESVQNLCQSLRTDVLVIGSEQPIEAGITDSLKDICPIVFAPSQAAGKLESSKIFMKDILQQAQIPTAPYRAFTDPESAYTYIDQHPLARVVKADGLAGGKGVVVAHSGREAKEAVYAMMVEEKFGSAGKKILIEDLLEGQEFSFFSLCHDDFSIPFGSATDYKRAWDHDRGPNTGGMGTFSPVCSPELEKRINDKFTAPVLKVLMRLGIPYRGVMFFGFMQTATQLYVLEINVRFGDPECQSLMIRLESDFLRHIIEMYEHNQTSPPQWSQKKAVSVVLATEDYPSNPQPAYITELPTLSADTFLFQSNLKKSDNEKYFSPGGRICTCSGLGTTFQEARQRAYTTIQSVRGSGLFYRKDIAAIMEQREHKGLDTFLINADLLP